jgi:hypothetical protein
MVLTGDVIAAIERQIQRQHDDAITLHRRIFFEYPPDDDGCYVYTYYANPDEPLYHGYTTSARARAKEHWRKAPWATWAQDVRYRPCSSPRIARKLERRLQDKVPSLCHASGITRTYHGKDWSDIEGDSGINHVRGFCKRPGGHCDVEYWLEWAESLAEAKAA